MIPTAGIGAPLGDLELVAAAADTAIEDPGAADASQSTNSTLKHNNKAAAAAGVTLRTPSLMAWLTGGGAENGGVVLDPQSALRLAPVFLTWPDYHKTSTINDTLRVLWPFLKPSLEQQLRETAEAALRAKAAAGGEAAPNGGAAAYIKSLLLPKLDELRLETLDLGSEPPALHGIKVYPSEGDDVVIETCLVWSGGRGQTVTASATAALLNGGLRLYVPLTVRNLQLRAQARLMARRIDANTPPFVGTASASFLDQPELEFELPIGGVDVMSLPGVAWLFKHGLRWACQQLALHPRAVSLDLMPRGGLRPPPAGVLLLTLVRIEGLSGSGRNPLGSPDPYCLIQVVEAEEEQEEEEELDVGGRLVNGGGGGGGGAAGGGGASRRQTASSAATGQQQQQSRTTAVKPRARLQRQSQQQPAQRSATVANSRDPVYGQQFALLLRHPLECQVLRIEVRDDDLGWSDDVLGVVEVPLRNTPWVQAPRVAAPAMAQLVSKREAAAAAAAAAAKKKRQHQAAGRSGEVAVSHQQPAGGAIAAGGAAAETVAPAPAAADEVDPLSSSTAATTAPAAWWEVGSLGLASEAGGRSSSLFSGEESGGEEQYEEEEEGEDAVLPGGMGGSGGGGGGGGSAAGEALSSAAGAFGSFAQQTLRSVGKPVSSAADYTQRAVGRAAGAVGKGGVPGRLLRAGGGGSRRPRGDVYLEGVFYPLSQSHDDVRVHQGDVAASGAPTGQSAEQLPGGAAAAAAAVRPSVSLGRQRPTTHFRGGRLRDTDLGLLTVTVVRVTGLMGWSGPEPDPYVELCVSDPHSHRVQRLRSSVVLNQANPRWKDNVFEFPLVSAGSSLLLDVWDQATSLLGGIGGSSGKGGDDSAAASGQRNGGGRRLLGRLKLPILPAVSQGRLCYTWPLVDAQQGEAELKLDWTPLEPIMTSEPR